MSNPQKAKGRRLENLVAQLLNEVGISAERVPLSGSFGGKYDCDVIIGSVDHPKGRIECKNREDISDRLWVWSEGNDFLVIKKNRKNPLAVLPLHSFVDLLGFLFNEVDIKLLPDSLIHISDDSPLNKRSD